jgi:predicted transcriptional regulator
MQNMQNVTFRLPTELVDKFRVFAATERKSMTALAADAIERYMNDQERRRAAAKRFIEQMRKGYDLGTNGKITWTRDELHER